MVSLDDIFVGFLHCNIIWLGGSNLPSFKLLPQFMICVFYNDHYIVEFTIGGIFFSMQSFENPFGETPFKAIPSTDGFQAPPQVSTSSDLVQPTQSQNPEPTHAGAMSTNFDFGDSLSGITYSTSSVSGVATPANNFQLSSQDLPATNLNADILADILPPTGPSPTFTSAQPFSSPGGQPAQPGTNTFSSFQPQPGAIVPVSSNMVPQTQNGPSSGNYLSHGGSTTPQMPTGQNPNFSGGSFVSQQGGFTTSNTGNFYAQQGASTSHMTQPLAPQPSMGQVANFNGGNLLPQQGPAPPVAPQGAQSAPTGPVSQNSNDALGNLIPQTGLNTSVSSQQTLPNSTGSLVTTQPSKDKFEPKSAVWADTLSRGLVNLNISGREFFCLPLFGYFSFCLGVSFQSPFFDPSLSYCSCFYSFYFYLFSNQVH